MRNGLTAVTAFASGLILAAAASVAAAPSMNLKESPGTSSLIEFAREGGGAGRGGGGGMRSGGGGGGGAGLAGRSRGDGPGMRSGRFGDGGPAIRGGSRGDGPAMRGGRYAGDGPKARSGDRGDWKGGDKRRYAGRDHDGRKFHRHRVWRNGAWVWVYGPSVYAYSDDCGWILRRAELTGSPYWWNRYEACVAYY